MTTRHAEAGHRTGHPRRRGHEEAEGVQRITSAPEAGHVDRDARFVRYAWQMGIRTACFIGAFFTTGWVQIVLFIAAIVLPYVAVLLANIGTVSNGSRMDAVPEPPPTSPELGSHRQLGAGPETVQGETTNGTTDGTDDPGHRTAGETKT